jgi:hypothetical protein
MKPPLTSSSEMVVVAAAAAGNTTHAPASATNQAATTPQRQPRRGADAEWRCAPIAAMRFKTAVTTLMWEQLCDYRGSGACDVAYRISRSASDLEVSVRQIVPIRGYDLTRPMCPEGTFHASCPGDAALDVGVGGATVRTEKEKITLSCQDVCRDERRYVPAICADI